VSYLLDANVFIQAKNLHYGFDFCPAFWDWIDQGHRAGNVFSVEKVLDELRVQDDDLSAWAEARADMFLAPDAAVATSLQETSAWANTAGYDPAGVNTFLQGADYYLVAQARAQKHVVVTHELPADTPRKIKIPNACIGLSLKCVTPFTMLATEGARFILPGGT
jgi:hypothetical protein